VPRRVRVYNKSITVRVTENEKEDLKKACEKRGYSNVSVCLRDLIDAFIKSAQ
jgi:hypothetical protein